MGAQKPIAMAEPLADPGSFRDPSGHVYLLDGQVYRTVLRPAADAYEALCTSGLLDRLVRERWVVATEEVPHGTLAHVGDDAVHVLRHERIPFISYPYEWPFAMLHEAARFHLDLQLEVLDDGFALADASAYNVQFIGARPVFIDLLSFRPYRPGEFWAGYRQFCELFLAPLLMRAYLGIPHNAWLRGSPDGIPIRDFVNILPLRRKLSPRVLMHLVLQARMTQRAHARAGEAIASVRRGDLSPAGYRGILSQLRRWIDSLRPAHRGTSEWGHYAASHTYEPAEYDAKRRFVAKFAQAVKPAILLDLGCNSGDFSLTALEAGAGYAVGFDGDPQALDMAFERARDTGRMFLPLHTDLTNPSPDLGWRQSERKGFGRRAKADALLALALLHHLAIARNIPLDQATRWLVSLAPTGVIEFVPKPDPTVQTMLALRDDIFPDYTVENFLALIGRSARIVTTAEVSATGRTLVWYER